MLQVDKGYIPLMYYTWQGDIFHSKRAVFYMNFQWQQFKNRYSSATEETVTWQDALSRIDAWLSDAYQSIDHNELELATVQLDHANYELRMLRARHDLDYYLDYWYDFQDAIVETTEVAEDEMLCLLEWNEFEAMVKETRSIWQLIKLQSFDNELFGFSPEKEKQLEKHIKKLDDDLAFLEDTLDCANRIEIAKASQELRVDLMDVFRLFGHFEASKIHYAYGLTD